MQTIFYLRLANLNYTTCFSIHSHECTAKSKNIIKLKDFAMHIELSKQNLETELTDIMYTNL